ncbi:MAG: RIP metalloprotease RseP [Oleiphilaceae bacterium]|nr:RIP metalloprotease RseP [Oleiphilaceae bacterium]
MQIVQTVLALIVTLGILVTIHEFGHFWVARRCGVKVLRFSVGFGKPLYSRYDRHGTEYAVAAIPLGGYVKMLDEREGPVPEDQRHQAFNTKPPGKRIAIAAAGPAANFIFAIVAYWLLSVVGFSVMAPVVGQVAENSIAERMGLSEGMEIHEVDGRRVTSWRDINMRLLERTGEQGAISFQVAENDQRQNLSADLGGWRLDEEAPNPLAQFGIEPLRPDLPPVLGEIVDAGPAAEAGLKTGDRILRVSGESVDDWFELVERIQASPGEELTLTVERNGTTREVSVTPATAQTEAGQQVGRIGAGVSQVDWPEELQRDVRYGPVAAIPQAFSETWADSRLTLVAIQKMFTGLLSPTNLSGPITIARVAEASVSSGFESFIRFLAYLSVSLGILNLLPVPVLDGGQIVFYSVEAIRGKPLSEEVQGVILRIGILMIVTLMVFALYNDLMRL